MALMNCTAEDNTQATGVPPLIPESGEVGTVFEWSDILPMYNGELKLDRKPPDLPLREKLWVANDRRCQYCRRKVRLKSVTLDHVVARVNGGSNLPANKVVACKTCNGLKGSLSPEGFLKHLRIMVECVEAVIPAVRDGSVGVA